MIGQLLKAEMLKVKRKYFWFLTFLGPFGVVALQVVNYEYRKDYLFEQSDDRWSYYLDYVSGFTPLALVLGIAILTSFLTSIENETNAWKQWIALPVSKLQVYLAKFTMLSIFLFLSSILLLLFTLLYGFYLDLGSEVPYGKVCTMSLYPFFAALPILALQLWIATISSNQVIPILTGIMGTILTMSGDSLPDWLIWKWPILQNDWHVPVMNVWLGIGGGLVILLVSMFDFNRRDVK